MVLSLLAAGASWGAHATQQAARRHQQQQQGGVLLQQSPVASPFAGETQAGIPHLLMLPCSQVCCAAPPHGCLIVCFGVFCMVVPAA
jgi:hypothetical protein